MEASQFIQGHTAKLGLKLKSSSPSFIQFFFFFSYIDSRLSSTSDYFSVLFLTWTGPWLSQTCLVTLSNHLAANFWYDYRYISISEFYRWFGMIKMKRLCLSSPIYSSNESFSKYHFEIRQVFPSNTTDTFLLQHSAYIQLFICKYLLSICEEHCRYLTYV